MIYLLRFYVTMKKDSSAIADDRLKSALKLIQHRAQVKFGRDLTHNDMAEMAGVTKRSLGDWMRGVSAPAGMSAIFELLSQLDEDDVTDVLLKWRQGSSHGAAMNSKSSANTEKSRRHNAPVTTAGKKKSPK
jgi:DNA-binding transcriptional regulator YiaG